jgi:hypothetical protein
MPTLTRAANAHSVVSTGWTNSSNAFSTTGDNVYSTTLNGSTSKNLNHVGDFGFANILSAAIPDGSTIDEVRIRCEADLSGTGVGVLFGVLGRISGADSGSETTKTSTGEEEVVATLSGVTLSDLRSASTVLKARCRGAKGNTASAFTVFLDYVRLEVDYTEAGGTTFENTATVDAVATIGATTEVQTPATFGSTVQTKVAQVDGLTTITLTPATTPTNGNLVVLGYMQPAGTAVTPASEPSGFTSLRVDRTTLNSTWIYYKVAASEPSSYSWTVTGGLDQAAVFIEIAGPFNAGSLVNTSATSSGQGNATPNPTAITSTVADAVVLALIGFNQPLNTIGGWDGGYTERVEASGTSGIGANVAIATQVASSTGTFDTAPTTSLSCAWCTFNYAFAKGGGGATTYENTATVEGVASLEATAEKILSASATVDGTATVAPAAVVIFPASAAVAATATIDATTEIVGGANTFENTAAVDTVATVTATSEKVLVAAPTVQATADISAEALAVLPASATVNAQASITATVIVVSAVSASVAAVAGVAAETEVAGTLTADATVAATATITPTVLVILAASATVSTTATITATTEVETPDIPVWEVSASVPATASIDVTVAVVYQAASTVAVSASIGTETAGVYGRDVVFGAEATVTASATVVGPPPLDPIRIETGRVWRSGVEVSDRLIGLESG